MFIKYLDRNKEMCIINTDHISSVMGNVIVFSDGGEMEVDDRTIEYIDNVLSPTPLMVNKGFSTDDYCEYISSLKRKDIVNLFTKNDGWNTMLRTKIKADVGELDWQKLVYKFMVK